MALPSASTLLNLARKVDRLLALEEKHGAAIAKLEERLSDPDKRVTRLEAREEIMVEQAKVAAAGAASAVMMHSVADMARRIGGLEYADATRNRLPSPTADQS